MGMGGICPLFSLEMLYSVFVLQMLSKFLEYKVFMHHFKKMSSVSGALPLDPKGDFCPSIKPPHCPPLEKNPVGAHAAISHCSDKPSEHC